MTSASTIFSDPRRRNIAVLAAIALILVIAALLALKAQDAELAPHFQPQEVFPGLAAHARDITRVHIQSKAHGGFDVVFEPEKGWVLPSRDDYPASFDQLQHTLVGLASLETIEPKTARPDWYSYIGLGAPDRGGNGIRITVYDDKKRQLADLITGKTVDIGDPNGSQGLFVRRPGEKQTWLVQSWFEPKSDIGDWMDKTVMSIDRSRVQETDVEPATGPSYSVRRETPSQADFPLTETPKGRELVYPNATYGVAGAATDFTFDDVQPAKNLDFSQATHVVTRTFDGLNVSVDVIQTNGAYWARISAEAVKPLAEREAREINAHASGWAYKLPAYKGRQFMTTLDSMLKPLPAPAQSAPKK